MANDYFQNLDEYREQERVKELKLLEASYEMYENSYKDAKRKLKQKMKDDGTPAVSDEEREKNLSLIRGMQNDIVEQYKLYGGDVENLYKIKQKGRVSPDKKSEISIYDKKAVLDYLKNNVEIPKTEPQNNPKPITKTENIAKKVENIVEKTENEIPKTEKILEKTENITENNSWINSQGSGGAIFDVIPLPSKGQCYRNKMAKIPVAYLTAYDENILVSPNLYRDGVVLDYIIKNKIMDNSIDADSLVAGDRDAIILWLRATGYGNLFPITVTDKETGKQFETTVDLTKIKFKDFNLVGDENGYFDFTCPVSKAVIKFKFLTNADVKMLDLIENGEKKDVILNKVRDMADDIDFYIGQDSNLNKEFKQKLFDAQNTLTDWADKIEKYETPSQKILQTVTNRMEMMIVSVNGNSDKEFIHKFINGMNVRDSSSFRRYVNDNEPGLDYNLEVERPASLGGGSMPVFLQLDQFIFLNIA